MNNIAITADTRRARQSRIRDWIRSTFHYLMPEVAQAPERRRRFMEEANELAQACGMTREEAHRLVDYTWDRPDGDVGQEIGGVMVTLYGLADTFRLDVDVEERREINRIHEPDFLAKIEAKHQSKIDAGVG